MATFNIHSIPSGLVGSRVTKQSDADVLMGALVMPGSAEGYVAETASNASVVLGIATIDEAQARENESSGDAQEKYTGGQPVVYEGLVNGVVYNLLAAGTAFTEGDVVEPAANGLVAAGTTHPVGIVVDSKDPLSGSTQQGKFTIAVMCQRMYDWD